MYHRIRRAAASAACSIMFIVAFCAQAEEPRGSENKAGRSPIVADDALDTAAPPASACPSGMVEVKGFHCATVAHLCLEGREVIWAPPDAPGGLMKMVGTRPVHCPNGCPTPYFCDKFVEGAATCGTKEIADPKDGKKKIRVVDGAEKHFCIDDYEYPGVVGQLPRVMVSWREAKSLCESRGARLCGDDEWMLACEGPEHRPYPYGWERDAKACNIDKPQREPGVDANALASNVAAVRQAELARLDQREPIGSRASCVSPYGVHDMAGNVDEWTVNVTHHGHPFKSLFKGGHWVKGARNRCRPDTDSHNEDFAFYAEGFRCCADPK